MHALAHRRRLQPQHLRHLRGRQLLQVAEDEGLAIQVRQAIDPGASICVILSETGLKTEAAPPSRPAIAIDALPRRLAQEKPKRS